MVQNLLGEIVRNVLDGCFGKLSTFLMQENVESPEEVAQYLHQHIQHATNAGKIRSTITVFPPLKQNEPQKVQLWSHSIDSLCRVYN